MKKVYVKRKELKSIIRDLDVAAYIFDGFDELFWDMMSNNNLTRYGDAQLCLVKGIRKLKELSSKLN